VARAASGRQRRHRHASNRARPGGAEAEKHHGGDQERMDQLGGDGGGDRPALPAGQAFDHAERLPFLSQRNQIADFVRIQSRSVVDTSILTRVSL
jgi:hypothetical protein